jgi:hypothetical protein
MINFILSLLNPSSTPSGRITPQTRKELADIKTLEREFKSRQQKEADYEASLEMEEQIAERLSVLLVETPEVLKSLRALDLKLYASRKSLKASKDALRRMK